MYVTLGNTNSEKAAASTETAQSKHSLPLDRYTILQQHIRECEAKHGHDLDSLVPILETSSADLRAACEAAVRGLNTWIQDCNSGRWASLFSKFDKAEAEKRHDVLVKQLAEVQRALEHFRQVDRIQLVRPFERFFDPISGRKLKFDRETRSFAARFGSFVLVECFMTY